MNYEKEEHLYRVMNTWGTTYEQYLEAVNQIENINYQNSLFNCGFLHQAALLLDYGVPKNDGRVIEDLLQRKIDVNLQDKKGNTACMYLATNGPLSFILKILPYGVEPNLTNKVGNTLLWEVLFFRQDFDSPVWYEVIRELVSMGANPYIENGSGVSPMSIAERYHIEKLTEILRGFNG